MAGRSQLALSVAAALAAVLFALQRTFADSSLLTARYVLGLGLMGIAVVAVARLRRLSLHAMNGPAPDPVNLIAAGLATMSLWAVVWWLMDLANHLLEQVTGPLPNPQPMTELADSLLGVDLQAAAYELQILFAVVLVPLVLGGLLWALVQPELGAWIGRWRAAWMTGVIAGALMALVAVQDVAPTMPWGLASLGGYVVIGLLAALMVYLTGSPWAGITVHGTFAYASFAWRDDLFREFAAKDYFSLEWLTVILLGTFGAVILLQVIRFRTPRPADPPRPARSKNAGRWWMPLVVLLAAVVIMAALDIDARQREESIREQQALAAG